ncbi:MAG: DNA polymerase/3'-5' exonuclease PolX [Gemmatimonadota bacterium]
MENLDIARTLEELADLLEIQGANPFKVRAYRNAVRTIQGLTRPLAAMVEEGEDLTELPGIGKDMAAYITELVQTGSLKRFDEVAAQVPVSLVELVHLDGVGPKKAKRLWEELGVTNLEALEEALDAGKVETLAGFGKKSADRIRRAIEDYRKHSGRFRLDEAEQLIAGLVKHMKSAPGLERFEVAGSFRRRKETVGDVDMLAAAEGDGEAVVKHFAAFSGAHRVDEVGPTKGNIVLRSGLSIDLRVVPRHCFGAAFQYFTGSKEHSVVLRGRSLKMGMRLNEWGLFRPPEGVDPESLGKDEGEFVAGRTEEELYEALGLVWIPPELRENRGEVEAAEHDALPKLITRERIRGDLHMHTTWSDGKASVEEMVQACVDRGYVYMAISDHSRAMGMVGGLTAERAREQWEEIAAVREKFPGIEILRASEVDILKDGSLDFSDEILEELDLVIVSVHTHMELDGAAMTKRVLRAIQHPQVDILAHPTGRLLGRREPFSMDVEAVLEAAKELQVAVELNANPHRLDLNDVHLQRARELGVKVAINTDAHQPAGLDNMRFGIGQARRGWLEPKHVINTLTPKQFRKWRNRKRAS